MRRALVLIVLLASVVFGAVLPLAHAHPGEVGHSHGLGLDHAPGEHRHGPDDDERRPMVGLDDDARVATSAVAVLPPAAGVVLPPRPLEEASVDLDGPPARPPRRSSPPPLRAPPR